MFLLEGSDCSCSHTSPGPSIQKHNACLIVPGSYLGLLTSSTHPTLTRIFVSVLNVRRSYHGQKIVRQDSKKRGW